MTTCPSCSQPLGGDDRFCTGCGKPVSAAGAAASPVPATPAGTAVSSAGGFRWMWALLTIPIAVGTALVVLFGIGFAMAFMGIDLESFAATGGAKREVFAVGGLLGGMALAGLIVGWLSPGRTVAEPGVGLAAAVIALNVLAGDTQGLVMGWVVPFLLGAGGAWIGEWLQSRFAAR